MAAQNIALIELIKKPTIRALLSFVCEDFVKEKIDYNETYMRISCGVKIDACKDELFSIRGFLENIMYTLDVIPKIWWWNNIHRVEKLLTVAMCLERLNYLSLSEGVDPTPIKLPSYIVNLTEHVDGLKKTGFEELEKKHIEIFQFHPHLQIYTEGYVPSNL